MLKKTPKIMGKIVHACVAFVVIVSLVMFAYPILFPPIQQFIIETPLPTLIGVEVKQTPPRVKFAPEIGEKPPLKPMFFHVRDYFFVNRDYFEMVSEETYMVGESRVSFDVLNRVVYIDDVVSKPEDAVNLVFNR